MAREFPDAGLSDWSRRKCRSNQKVCGPIRSSQPVPPVPWWVCRRRNMPWKIGTQRRGKAGSPHATNENNVAPAGDNAAPGGRNRTGKASRKRECAHKDSHIPGRAPAERFRARLAFAETRAFETGKSGAETHQPGHTPGASGGGTRVVALFLAT